MPLSLHYIVWDCSPNLWQAGSLSIKWYGVCMLLAFLGGRQVIRYIYRTLVKPMEDVDTFSTWVLWSALVGARIGEILFYNPSYYLTHPVEALLPLKLYPQFQFTGYAGLSIHGAIVGVIVGTYYYARRKRQSFLQLSTPLALAMMMGFLIRIGNFMNSEIVGTPTHDTYGVLFARDVTETLKRTSNFITEVTVHKRDAYSSHAGYQPITLRLVFKEVNVEEKAVRRFVEKNIKRYLTNDQLLAKHIYETSEKLIDYALESVEQKTYVVAIKTLGIPRHPVQLYESIAYLLTLVVHLYWWRRRHKVLQDGVIAGSIMSVCYGLRFIAEFFKDPFSVLFDGSITLTVGHLLSLLTVLGGIAMMLYSRNNTNQPPPSRAK